MKLKSLTQAFVDSQLVCPPNERSVEFCCPVVGGMYIRVTATKPGEGIFYQRYHGAEKKTKHHRIGRTTEISLHDAREAAKRFKAELALGMHRDVETVAEGPKEPPTLKAFYKTYFLPHVKQHKRSWRSDQQLFELRILPKFGDVRIDQLSRHEVQVFHGVLKANGLAPATADHHLKVLRHALNLAKDWDLIERNPLARIKLFNEDNRVENLLSEEQLKRLVKVLEEDDSRPVCLIAQFLLCTGARRNEVLSARWEDIDLQKKHWLIPAQNSKSKRVRPVPLNDSALHVLGQLPTREKGGNLFINRQTGRPYTDIAKVWQRLRLKAGLPHLRIHDLRHTFASLLVNGGRTLYEVQKILGHSSPIVTERYAHLSSQRMLEAANVASVLNANVVPIAA